MASGEHPQEPPEPLEPPVSPRRPGARRIGIVGNPRSHSYGALGQDEALIRLAEPETRGALRQTLRDFATNGVDLLVVQGGDGTLRDVLSALPEAYGDSPPDIAILATGNTNLAARVFGRVQPGPRGLASLAAAAQCGTLRRATCHTLRVEWPGEPDRLPLRGLFFGAGLYTDGKAMADARIHASGVHNGLAVALAVLSTVLRAVLGRRGGTERVFAPDDGPIKSGRGFVILATTLDRLMLGFWPFGRHEGRGRSTIRWLDIDAPVRGLLRTLLGMALGRDAGSGREGERRTGLSRRITLRLQGRFVLDGEFFDPGAEGVVLSDGGAVTIVSV
ncbi:acylglycerol kinase family protein [Acetobacteraceae bacterium KSS8]|uniref:Acylglycerol kinase family protein n=1 Tax=Endosaccharibacter trunci TaxID=2812733 RepID=A0ABT1W6W7_9PROT|nr:acylglycerol kinase family protein [Acetobacteraceae bacterium KSS8]